MEKVIPLFLTFIAEAVILIQYSDNLFEPKKTTGKRVLMLGMMYIGLFAVSLLEVRAFNIALYFLVNTFFFFSQYNLIIWSAILHSAIITAIMGMSELVVYALINRFTTDIGNIVGSPYTTILFATCSKALFYIITFILSHIFKRQKQKNNSIFLIIIPMTSIFVMITFVYLCDMYKLSIPAYWLIVICAILLLGTSFVTFWIDQYNQKRANEFFDMKLQLQKESDILAYYKMLTKQNEDQRILVHDIKNHLQSIYTLNQTGEKGKINDYIKNLLDSTELKGNVKFCESDILNSILHRYAGYCRNEGINFSVDIRKGTDSILSESDLTSLFSNLLDNAVEAAKGAGDAFIELDMKRNDASKPVLITIINACENDPFKNNPMLQTTKTDRKSHGYGLKSINRIVKKYNGDINMYFNPDDNTFHTIITIMNS